MALQFLLEGAEAGERGLYVTPVGDRGGAARRRRSHGWAIGRQIEIFELVPPESLLDADQQQSLLYSSDLELGETDQRIFEAVERLKPHARRASTACRRSGCSRRARCAIAARSWR